jgi:hypothetical protein
MLALPATRTAASNGSSAVAAPECSSHQRNLDNPTNSHNRVLDSYWFEVTHGTTTTAVCDLQNTVQSGDTVTAHFVMSEGAAAGSEITLISNNAQPPNPHDQTLFECASFGDTAGSNDPCSISTSQTLTVKAAECGFQVDLIYDEPVTPMVQGEYLSHHRFISGDEGKGANCTIATTPVPTATPLGQPIKDTATVTPSTITGSVTFNLFGTADSNCSQAPVFSSSGTLSGGQATSGSFTPTSTGTYHWTASMSNPSLASACADEAVVITAGPAISTVASAGGPVGTAITDSATVTGVTSPTGNVVFNLFGPTDTNCSQAPVATDTEPISSSGTAHTTKTIAPQTTGTYQWTATYTGVTPILVSTCGSEPVTITAAIPNTGGPGGGAGAGIPNTGAELPLPLGAGLIVAGMLVLVGGARPRRRLG